MRATRVLVSSARIMPGTVLRTSSVFGLRSPLETSMSKFEGVRMNQTAATSAPSAPQIKTSRFARRPKVDPITVTDAAVSRIRALLERKPEANGVRLGVRTRGCNGLSYTLDYLVGEPKAGEDIVETRGVKVVIEPKALIHLIGTTMDYKEDALASEFVFQNPNAKGSCGCGESFNV